MTDDWHELLSELTKAEVRPRRPAVRGTRSAARHTRPAVTGTLSRADSATDHPEARGASLLPLFDSGEALAKSNDLDVGRAGPLQINREVIPGRRHCCRHMNVWRKG